MKTKIFICLTIFLVFLSISTVVAGDNTTDNTYIPKSNVNDGQVVETTESTIIIDNSTSIIQNNNYTNITYVNFTKTENNITVIYNCAIINIGCGNTTDIINETINNSSICLNKSLNQPKSQLNNYITMKPTGKLLIILILMLIVISIGSYGYRRKK